MALDSARGQRCTPPAAACCDHVCILVAKNKMLRRATTEKITGSCSLVVALSGTAMSKAGTRRQSCERRRANEYVMFVKHCAPPAAQVATERKCGRGRLVSSVRTLSSPRHSLAQLRSTPTAPCKVSVRTHSRPRDDSSCTPAAAVDSPAEPLRSWTTASSPCRAQHPTAPGRRRTRSS